jgi:hypothetical protein
MKQIKFTVAKTGQLRAYYYQRQCMRWLPMPVAEAQLLLATGQATEYKPLAALDPS